MLRKTSILLALPIAAMTLTQCVDVYEAPGNSSATQLPSYGQPMTSINGQGSVAIMEGARRVSACYTASPNIEQTRFINEQQQIVIKSRGNHGPATVELFDTRSGSKQGTVMAYELAGGGPSWAAGMAD